MEGSSLTNEEIEAALQLIQLISSGSRRDATIGKFKVKEEDDGDSTSAAYSSSPSPSSIKKILGERKRKLFPSTRARIRIRIQNKETKAAEQLLHLSEEEGEEGGGEGESGGNISEASNVTDESCAVAVETRADQDGERQAKQEGGAGSKSERRGLASVCMEEEGEGDFLEEDWCLADVLRRRRKRKFRSLIDIYTNGPRD